MWLYGDLTSAKSKCGSFENKALENEDQSTKHPNLENEAPKKLDTGLSFINTRPM